jgi:hypothetical protein
MAMRFMFRSLVVLMAVCPGPAALADRPAIEQVLGQMSSAAAAADADGYLSHVSHADPIFFKEQSNWAKDLKRKPPAGVTFTIGEARDDDAAPEFGDSVARFEMVTTWSMPTSDGSEPRARDVSYPVRFVLEGGNWLYAGEDWLVLEGGNEDAGGHAGNPGAGTPSVDSPPKGASEPAESDRPAPRPRDERFQGSASRPEPETAAHAHHNPLERTARVKYFPGYEEVARRIVQVLPEVRDHVDEGFGERIPRAQEVKIYPSMRHLQESIYLSYVDGLSGWNEPGESIKILTRPTTSARALRSLLAHEYGHVATFALGPKANDMPWWILEGVAELAAERYVGNGSGHNAEAMVIMWHNAGRLSPWDDLADFHKVQESAERDLQGKVYKQGQHMLMFISDTFGRDARTAWLREMANGRSVDEASRDALKMPFAEVDTKWRAAVDALAAKAAAEKLAKESEPPRDKSKPSTTPKPKG